MVRHPRFHVHFAPTSASWLNQVERFIAALTEKQIRRNSFRSIRDYLDHHNKQPKPFLWTKSADDILNVLAKYCERTKDSGH
jgi:transposase